MGILALVLGAALIFVIAWAVWMLIDRARITERLASATTALDQLTQSHDAELRAMRTSGEEARAAVETALGQQRAAFENAIKVSAGDAMSRSSAQLLELAKTTFAKEQSDARTLLGEKVGPIAETLKKTEAKLGEIEKERLGAYERLSSHMKQVGDLSESLRKETGNLVAALRKPQVRGRYGEIQLKRVAELSGMRDYCDFTEQESSRDDAGGLRKPDMVVTLPNGRCVVVDAKTNIEAYIDAIDAADDAQRDRHLDRFARHVADQAGALSKKEYWSQFDGAADFVVMFIPGDQFIDAALQRRPDLLDLAAEQRIILASPSTLIGLLRAMHVGWREKGLSDRADELFDLGKELHRRMAKVLEDFSRLGKRLDDATGAYNEAVASVDARLMPTLRRFEDAGARSEKTFAEPVALDVTTRPIKSLPAADEVAP
jgi:DNA recombination protein RmuC